MQRCQSAVRTLTANTQTHPMLLLVEAVGLQALEDHGIYHRVGMFSVPPPSDNAR